jgi:hypothetical protein
MKQGQKFQKVGKEEENEWWEERKNVTGRYKCYSERENAIIVDRKENRRNK